MSDDVIELEEVMERVQDDKELLLELLDIFQEDYREKRIKMDKLIQKQGFEELKNIAHSLKGASSNISAKKIFVTFAKLEDVAEKGNVEEIRQLIAQIDRQYEELSQSIKKLKVDLS